MTANSTKLGPGTLTLGDTGTTFDASCQLVAGGVTWDKDTKDPIKVLCGDSVAGGTTYSASFSGTVLQDLADEEGLVNFTWEHKGEDMPFEFVPNNDAKATVTGVVTIDPLDVGDDGADFGDTLTSDFEWACVGEPTLTWPASPPANGGTEATEDETAAEPELAGV